MQHLLVLFFLLHTIPPDVLPERWCSSNKQCNDVGYVVCGYCRHDECSYFNNKKPAIYTDGSRCNFVKDNCIRKKCQMENMMYNFEGFGTCVCTCVKGYYGQQCQQKGEKNVYYPTGIQLFVPNSVFHSDLAKSLLAIQRGGGQRFTYIIEDITGSFIVVLHRPNEKDVFDSYGRCRRELGADNPFCQFFKPVIKELFVFDLELSLLFNDDQTKDAAHGRLTLVFCQIYENFNVPHKERLLKMDWIEKQVHVTFPTAYQIYPVVRLTNCGFMLRTRLKYRLKNSFQLNSEVFFIANYKLVSNPSNLQFYKWGWKAKLLKDEFLGWSSADYEFWNIDEFTWNIQAYSFPIGIYIIRFQIDYVMNRDMYNFDQCYLEMILDPLRAVLAGGSARSVTQEDGLVLDAKGSTDFNVPPAKVRLRFTFTCNWTQETVCRPTVITGSTMHKIKPFVLHLGQVYEFKLKVENMRPEHNINPAFAIQQITVVEELSTTITSVEIECIYNCEMISNTKDITYLRVKGPWKTLRHLEFEWVSVKGMERTTDDIRIDTPSYILLILSDKLEENEDYNFRVKVKDDNRFAVYTFVTSSSTNTTCMADPTSGVKGVTSFNITCVTEHNDLDVQFTYEFYDKDESDGPDFSGRMLARQRTGGLYSVLLTRGKVEIITFDETGMMTASTLEISLSENNMTAANVEDMVTYLKELSGLEDVSNALRRASVVSEVLNPEMNRNDIFLLLLSSLTDIRLDTFAEAKLSVSTLYNILITISRRENFTLSLDGAYRGSRVLRTIGETLARTIPLNSQCTFQTMYQMLRKLLDCIYILLEVKNKEVQSEPYEFTNPAVYSQVKGISRNVKDCLSNMASILLRRHLPSQPHQQIDSSLGNFSMWVKVDTAEAISNFTVEHNLKDRFPIIISRQLAKDVEDLDSYMGLQYTSFEQNPLSLKKVNTDCFDVNVCYKSGGGGCYSPRRLKSPIVLEFSTSDINSEIEYVNGSAVQLDPSLPPEQLDLDLSVYRLDVKPRASVLVEFQFDSDVKELKVLVEKHLRPDYKMVIEKGTTVSENSSVYRVSYTVNDEPDFYYMAVLPAPSVPKNTVVKFKFKTSSKVCYSWHGLWGKESCQVKENSNQDRFLCQCTHLSLFSALVEATPTSLDSVDDVPLLFTQFSNLQNQLTLALLLLLFFLLLVLVAAWVDRHNRVKRFAVVLKDNYPGNSYGYLICVNTGARIGAGTDAPLGIRIYGTHDISRPHILASDFYDVMEGLGEDWFVMYTPTILGDIEYVDIWHDNSGYSPDWFCDSVVIYDLTRMKCYFFLVNEWVTLSYKRVPQIVVFPTPLQELAAGPRAFLDNLKSGFLLSHLWMSTVVRHPRDPVTRVDRLAIILCFILVAMATGLGLVRLTDDFIEVDDPEYAVTSREFVFSLFSLVVAALSACILMAMFKKTYKIIFYIKQQTNIDDLVTQKRESVTYQTVSRDDIDPGVFWLHYGNRQAHQKKEKTFREMINLVLATKPLVPVQLQGDDPNVYINWAWCAITWLTVMVIVVACTIVCVLWSRDLPPVKTKKWLTIAGLAALEHIFVLLPIKIILTSLLLALAFKRLMYKDIYTFNPEDGTQRDLFGDVNQMLKIVNQRCQPMYLPLHECLKEDHRQWSVKVEKWRKLFHLLQMLALLVVVSGLLTTDSFVDYHSNAHLRSLLMDSRTTPRSGFYSVFNRSEYVKFFQYSLDDSLFAFGWYNLESLNTGVESEFYRRDWLFDRIYRMLGRVRSRQLRVAPGLCEAPHWAQNATKDLGCAAPWRGRNEDEMDYKEMWMETETTPNFSQRVDVLYIKGILDSSPKWGYTKASADPDFYYYGQTGSLYPPGGYVRDLGASSEELEVYSMEMYEEWWLGHFTRAVLTQITAYNVNTECFTEVVLVMEQTISGEYIPTIVVRSVVTSFRVQVWVVLFVLFTIQFCLRLYMMMSYTGLLGFFSKTRRTFEMGLFILSVASLLYLLLHYTSSPSYVQDYLYAEENVDFKFYEIAKYSFTARSLLCYLFILALLRFYSLWQFGRLVYTFFYTFKISLRTLIWTMVVFIMFTSVIWRFIGYLLSVFIDVIYNPNLFYKTNFLYLSNNDQPLPHKVIAFLVCFGSAVVIALFVCVFVYEYKRARKHHMRDWTLVNLILFVFGEAKSFSFETAHQVSNLDRRAITQYARKLTRLTKSESSI